MALIQWWCGFLYFLADLAEKPRVQLFQYLPQPLECGRTAMIGTIIKTSFDTQPGGSLFDEIKQMACRCVQFDMNELVYVAPSSTTS